MAMLFFGCTYNQLDLRLSSVLAWTVCKLFFSKITWPFPQKSHECALKLTDLWNTSLLFDSNYKFELIGASLLPLAKSIYYLYFHGSRSLHSIKIYGLVFIEQ